MFGSIMPEPFATHVIVASPTLTRDRLRVRVRRHDSLGADERIVLQVGRHAADAALDDLDRQRHADDAGRAHEDAIRRGADLVRPRPPPCATRSPRPSRPSRRYCTLLLATIARSTPFTNRLAPEDDRGARKLVAREHRGRVRLDVAREEREILGRRA